MGTDTVIWVHKDDLKELDLNEALFLYRNFTGRWQYTILDKFKIEGNVANLEDIKASLQNNATIPQEHRDLIKKISGLRIIFQSDFEGKEPQGYLELSFYLRKGWEDVRSDIR